MKSGIYLIKNTVTNKVYIGQSKDLSKRRGQHLYTLRRGEHFNSHLQKAFMKHGEDAFAFEVLEKCDINELDSKECFWISSFNSTDREYGYNFESGGSGQKVMHEETREKIRQALKGTRLGKDNPMFGKKLSSERKEQLKLINQGRSEKLIEEDVRLIKMALCMGIMQTELADLFNVRVDTINKIAYGVNWPWVLEHLNEEIVSNYQEKKEGRNEKIISLFERGFTTREIMRLVRCDNKKVMEVIGASRQEIREERNKNILVDFENGLTQKEIVKKYSLEESGVRRILQEAVQKKRTETYEEVIRLKAEGMKNIDIAKVLGIHRTTVTEYIKGRVKGERRKSKPLTDELKKEILSLIDQGKSQREVGRILEVSRFSIRRTLETR